MGDDRQPHAPWPQPTDAFVDDGSKGFHSSRTGGTVGPPAVPATPVTTRPLLVPDDGTEATPPGPGPSDGPLSEGGAPPVKPTT
jgi:hypothetical protein